MQTVANLLLVQGTDWLLWPGTPCSSYGENYFWGNLRCLSHTYGNRNSKYAGIPFHRGMIWYSNWSHLAEKEVVFPRQVDAVRSKLSDPRWAHQPSGYASKRFWRGVEQLHRNSILCFYDRYFINQIATRILDLTTRHCKGNYNYIRCIHYLEKEELTENILRLPLRLWQEASRFDNKLSWQQQKEEQAASENERMN